VVEKLNLGSLQIKTAPHSPLGNCTVLLAGLGDASQSGTMSYSATLRPDHPYQGAPQGLSAARDDKANRCAVYPIAFFDIYVLQNKS